jgi:hypothetical protein
MDMEYRFSATENSGKITSHKDSRSGEEVTYQYDSLQRLISAAKTDPSWGLSFNHDGFGNRLDAVVTKGAGPAMSLLIDKTNNRIMSPGFSYDANGHMTASPLLTGVSYDIENRLKGANGDQYGYDAGNKRIWKKKPTNSDEFYFYGAMGEKIATYQPTTVGTTVYLTSLSTNLYFAGKPICEQGQVVVVDRLGSVRSGGERYFPYGEEQVATIGDKQMFATYFRMRRLGWIMRTSGTTQACMGGLGRQIAISRVQAPETRTLGIGMHLSVGTRLTSMIQPDRRPVGSRYTALNYSTATKTFYQTTYYYCANLIPTPPKPPYIQPGGGGQPGSGGPQMPRRDWARMDEALDIALVALKQPACAGIFETPETRARRWDPAQVLINAVKQTPFAKISYSFVPQIPGAHALTFPAVPVYAPGATGNSTVGVMTMRTPTLINSASWNVNTPVQNANTLAHELGHTISRSHRSDLAALQLNMITLFLIHGAKSEMR